MRLLIILEFLRKLDDLGLVGSSLSVELDLQLLFRDLDFFVLVQLDAELTAVLLKLLLFVVVLLAPTLFLLRFAFEGLFRPVVLLRYLFVLEVLLVDDVFVVFDLGVKFFCFDIKFIFKLSQRFFLTK